MGIFSGNKFEKRSSLWYDIRVNISCVSITGGIHVIFHFFCPFCNQKIDCDDELENQIVPCPSCNQEIVPIRSSLDETVSLVDGETLSHTENKQDVEKLKLNFTRNLCGNLRFLYVAAILIIIIAGVTGVVWFCLSGQDCRKHETNQFRSARYSLELIN